MSVSIVIVNWNSGGQLKECVTSIIDFHGNVVDEIVIVDNNSSDYSIDRISNLESDFFAITIIRQYENLGFGKACNLAAQKIKSKYILFLNPDTILYPFTMSVVFDFMESNDSVGVCGIKLIDSEGNTQKHCTIQPKLCNYINHATGLSMIAPRLFPYIFLTDFDYNIDSNVEHTIGAFYCIRNSLFKQLNGFDEIFFVYLEDLDLSRRVQMIGYKIQYLSSASAFHKGGGTSEQVKAFRLFYSLRSRLFFGFKHFSTWQAYSLVFVTVVIEFLTRIIKALLSFSKENCVNTLVAYSLLLKSLPGIIKKGRKIND